MSTATPVAVATAREINNRTDSSKAIVRHKSEKTYLCVKNSAPVEVDRLIRDGWLISPSSARENNITLFKR